MRLQTNLKVMLAVTFMTASLTAAGQSAPSAVKGGWPLAAGGGISVMNPDFGHGAMVGITAYGDYVPQWVPKWLYGIGLDAEARDLSFHRSASQANLRQDTIGGGAIYFWMHYQNFHPFIKALGEFGNFEFEPFPGDRNHNSRTLGVLGGGAEYHVQGNIWVRGDYEYQYWPSMFYFSNPPNSAQPQGFTVGVQYHFRMR